MKIFHFQIKTKQPITMEEPENKIPLPPDKNPESLLVSETKTNEVVMSAAKSKYPQLKFNTKHPFR